MASRRRPGKKTEYSINMGDFRGVDRDGGSISPVRLSACENMYKDYGGDGGGVIESIPGFRRLYSFGKRIKRIYHHKSSLNPDNIIVHTEDALYSFTAEIMENLFNEQPRGSVSSGASAGFSFGDNFYLLDGTAIHRLDRYHNFHTVREGDASIYIPTAYINGEEYEQRNLLTDRFREEYRISDPYRYSYATPELIYTVTDPDKLWCAVTGIKSGYSGAVYIPKYADVDGTLCEVRRVGDRAFEGNTSITSVIIASGIYDVGPSAFLGCTSLGTVSLPDSVISVGDSALSGCVALSELYLGGGIASVGANAFYNTPALREIRYAGTESDFYAIDGQQAFINKGILCRERYGRVHVSLPVSSEAYAISGVTLDGASQTYEIIRESGKITSLRITLTDQWDSRGRTVVINGTYGSYPTGGRRKNKSFPETLTGQQQSCFSAISRCTVAVVFDGRVFYSGNPDIANTVFFTERDSTGENNPLYVGAMNYFNDGLGAYPVTSLLPVRDALAVFKGGDDGGGSIFYHTPHETGDSVVPKSYPVAYRHSGVSAHGPSVSFLDDPVFLSPTGLSALADKNISYERNVVCRSHNVNFDLLKDDLSDATVAVWLGYLAICTRGRIYLADSRATFRHETGNTEYEWFILTGIGCYSGDARLFRYDSCAPEGFSVHPDCDGAVSATIYSSSDGSQYVLHTEEGGQKYTVYPTDEWVGGVFSPAVCIGGAGELLFFGTERGELCVFNNDKRGVPPDYLASDSGFDPEEYKELMGTRIHPDFYSFDRHAPRYVLSTKFEDCGLSHLTKDTVKGSLTVKCKSCAGNKITLEVATDRNGYREIASFTGGGFDFSSLDFASLSFDRQDYSTIPFREKEKGWVEKQITLSSSSYASPIGILSISYRYTVKGNIKPR